MFGQGREGTQHAARVMTHSAKPHSQIREAREHHQRTVVPHLFSSISAMGYKVMGFRVMRTLYGRFSMNRLCNNETYLGKLELRLVYS